MSLAVCLLLAALAPQAPVVPAPPPLDPDSMAATLAVQVDSGRHEVVITAGPFNLPDMSGHEDHSMSHDTPVYRFQWPVRGWFRGFRVEVLDSAGGQLPKRLMHHMIMINYDRRQLIYQAAERLWGAGVETGSVSLPKTIGVPIDPASNLGLYIAWHNDTGENLNGVRLRMTMEWTPRNQMPRPVDVLPFYFDVNLTVGGDNEFDIPPGHSEQVHEFVLPTDGRILGVGGHLHQYGKEVRLEDAESGKVLTRVEARLRPNGKIDKIERHLFGVAGQGLKLRAGHRYRVVAVYDNPTDETLVKGAMGSMVGIFAPSDLKEWPVLEADDSLFQKDLKFLTRRGVSKMGKSGKGKKRDSMAADSTAKAHQHEHQHR